MQNSNGYRFFSSLQFASRLLDPTCIRALSRSMASCKATRRLAGDCSEVLASGQPRRARARQPSKPAKEGENKRVSQNSKLCGLVLPFLSAVPFSASRTGTSSYLELYEGGVEEPDAEKLL